MCWDEIGLWLDVTRVECNEEKCLVSVLSSIRLNVTWDRGRDTENELAGVCWNVIGDKLVESISVVAILSSIILNVTRDRGCDTEDMVEGVWWNVRGVCGNCNFWKCCFEKSFKGVLCMSCIQQKYSSALM